ncbi:hypothetical protein NXY15_04910 [Bacteroides thetaiotaomicron]|nr:hypothetical protein NXY15_04910 [Bacteroides thetaiotaomicron]
MMNLRGAVTEKWNKEVVWANSQSWVGSGSYDNYQIQAMPRDLVPAEMLRMLRTEPIWVFLLD